MAKTSDAFEILDVIIGDDGRPGSAAFQGHRPGVQAELSHLLGLAVATGAAGLQDGEDFFLEVNLMGDCGQFCERVP